MYKILLDDGSDLVDADGDGYCGAVDNCPTVANGVGQSQIPNVGDQTDSDLDGVGDACDGMPNDFDNDGTDDVDDNCPTVFNTNQSDVDSDGTGDACDSCPNDPNKTIPGMCGCGVADTDTDLDGTPDCNDTAFVPAQQGRSSFIRC